MSEKDCGNPFRLTDMAGSAERMSRTLGYLSHCMVAEFCESYLPDMSRDKWSPMRGRLRIMLLETAANCEDIDPEMIIEVLGDTDN